MAADTMTIPDALKPAICPKCCGRGGRPVQGSEEFVWVCSVCGGSGINPAALVDAESWEGGQWWMAARGLYVAIPLEER